MEIRCFMFDLVILNVSVQNFDYKNNTLTVVVDFNGTEFTIEPNTENPNEFKQGRTCEFKMYPDDLRNDLVDRPLKLKVIANGNEVKGVADIPWPTELLNKLETENFIQFSHFEQCDIRLNRAVSGKIGIQYRLRAKCELSQSDGEEPKNVDIQDELKKLVNPNEVFFLIQNDSDDCNTLIEKEMGCNKTKNPCPTALDLAKFRNYNGKVIRDMGVFDQVYSLDCCHTRQYNPGDCKQNVASIGTHSQYGRDLPKQEESKSSIQWACKARQHVNECPHSNKFSDETESCSCECVAPKSNIFDNGKMKNICGCPETPPELVESVYVRSKLCSICKSDVSWLPKLAACPKCGHKPVPYSVERPYNENLTADQILEEWAVNAPPKSLINEKDIPKESRCTCKNGKVCAHCRIRKLCRDAVKTAKCGAEKSGKSSVDSQKLPDKLCKSTDESDSRIHLAKVFSELRDLYSLKSHKAKRTFEPNEICEKEFAKPKRLKSLTNVRPSVRSIKKEKIDFTKNLAPEVKEKWCKGKSYNYKAVRKYPGTLIGHQTCVSSGKYVPSNMGWLWNTDTCGIRRGWKPGAIRKPIKEIMKYFLKDFPIDSLRVSKYSRNKVVKKESEELVQKPTLQISKKQGVYTITMRPLKDATLLKQCADPYVAMKPLIFRIVKNPLLVYASDLKKILKKHFRKCTCHRPISGCYCRTFLDKKRLEFETNKICRQKNIPSLKNTLVLSDTTDSEDEFDFGITPPAGIIKPHLKNKPDLACRETQYSEKDWVIKPVFPMAPNKYMRPFDSSGGRMNDGAGDGSSSRRGILKGGRGGRGGGRGGRGRSGREGAGHIVVGGINFASIIPGRGAFSRNTGVPFKTTGLRPTYPPPLFNSLARRRKPEAECCICPPPETYCVPGC